MSGVSIELNWQRSGAELRPGKYSNAHTVRYNDSYQLRADAAPDWGGDASNTNPEQALERRRRPGVGGALVRTRSSGSRSRTLALIAPPAQVICSGHVPAFVRPGPSTRGRRVLASERR